MTAPPRPTSTAIARVQSLGEKALIEFLDEVSGPATDALAETSLPFVSGFRKTSKPGLKRRKRALALDFLSHRSGSSNRSRADQALYAFWRAWAIERLGDAAETDKLLHTIEESGEDGSSETPNSPAAVVALFSALNARSRENKCSRETIERFFTFSPFDESPEIRSLIDGAKSSADMERDAAIIGLPQRLRQDEEELRSLAGQLHSLAMRIDSSDEINGKIGRDLAVLATVVSRLERSQETFKATIDAHAKTANSFAAEFATRGKSTAAFQKEVREELAVQAGELRALADLLAQQAAEMSSAISVLADRVTSLEHARGPGQPLGIIPQIGASQTAIHAIPLSIHADQEATPVHSLEEVIAVLASNLEKVGLKKSAAKTFAVEVCAAAFAGQIVFFAGTFATLVARMSAASFAGKVSFRLSMPVGVMDGEDLRRAVSNAAPSGTDAPALVIEGVNRSAFDVIAEVLSDLASGEILQSPGRWFVFGSITRGPASLSLDPGCLEMGPVFDTDHLDWRTRRIAGGWPTAGSITPEDAQKIRVRLEASSPDFEEPLKLLRRFQSRKNLRMESTLVAAFGALASANHREGPSALQSLSYGWLFPLWVALGVSREEADEELDGGKCDRSTPDSRLAGLLAGPYLSKRRAEE